MSKFGQRLLKSVRRAARHAQGEDVGYTEETFIVPDKVNVKAIRKGVDMTQTEFASFYGFNIASVRSWEQGNRQPSQSSRILLKVIEKRPEIIPEVFAMDVKLVTRRKTGRKRQTRIAS